VGTMGLLDDAIREHLEFKRLRGADPSEVAREEHTALGRVQADDDAGALEDPAENGSMATQDALISDGARPILEPSSPYAGQETAELDMQAVLEGEPD
jgi:hypothetical protein